MFSDMDMVRNVKLALTDLGLDKIPREMESLTQLVKAIQDDTVKLRESLEFTQDDHEKTKNDVRRLEAENSVLYKRLDITENRVITMEKSMRDVQEGLVDMTSRSMKDNLVFNGIPESAGEDTRMLLLSFMKNRMKIDDSRFHAKPYDATTDDSTIWIHRCHGFGQTGRNGAPRPIVAKLISGRSCVMKHARNLAGT